MLGRAVFAVRWLVPSRRPVVSCFRVISCTAQDIHRKKIPRGSESAFKVENVSFSPLNAGNRFNPSMKHVPYTFVSLTMQVMSDISRFR